MPETTRTVLTEVSGYSVRTPEALRAFVRAQLLLRNIESHIGKTPSVIGLLPLATPTISQDTLSGNIPCVAVWQNSKRVNPRLRNHAHGRWRSVTVDDAWLTSVRLKNLDDRASWLLMSDEQLDLVQSAVTARGPRTGQLTRHYKDEQVKIQCWVESDEDAVNLLADMVDAIIMRMGEEAGSRLKNFDWSGEWGATNFEFQRNLLGVETSLSFTQMYWNLQIFDEAPVGTQYADLTEVFGSQNLDADFGDSVYSPPLGAG